MAERVIAFDLANERIVLASMVHDVTARRDLALQLSDSEFGDERHQAMFRGLARMGREGLEWSEDTLVSLAGGAESIGGYAYLRQLVREYEPNKNLEHHIERLRLEATKFKIVRDLLPELSEACADPSASRERLAAVSRRLETAVGANLTKRFVNSGKQLINGYFDELRARRVVGGVFHGTGFKRFDEGLIRGLAPGLITVVGARPRVGKSVWATNLIRNLVGMRSGVYLCAWEMRQFDYMDMLVSMETGIPLRRIMRHADQLTEDERHNIAAAARLYENEELFEIERNPFPHLERPSDRWSENDRNLDHFEASISQASRTKRVVILDVVMKMFPDRRPDKIAAALVRVQQVAVHYGVHVIALHHLNRETEGRPTLEDFKGSGAWEEDGDLLLGFDRPTLRVSSGKRRRMKDVLDVHVLKQRMGEAPLCYRYDFNGACARLENEVAVDIIELEREEREEDQGTV